MSGTTRILVVSQNPSVLKCVGQAAQPKGYLLFQADSLSEIKLRLDDLSPELVVLDASHPACAAVGTLSSALDVTAGDAMRPQFLLVGSGQDPHRRSVAAAIPVDAMVELPLDPLEMAIEVRTLVRVRIMAADALRDRDLLNQLFELSTFTENYDTVDAVLASLAGRLAEWMRMPHVVVTLGSAQHPRIAAGHHASNGTGGRGRTLVERRHHELVQGAHELCIDESDGVLSGEDPSSLPYVGLPLKGQQGKVLGALHAWGGEQLPDDTHLRVLRAAAERIGAEIQLGDSHRRLEEMVEARTADLTALLARLRGVNNQLLEASRETIMRLARAAEYRDGDTGEHVERMSSYSQIIARQMGMGSEEQALIKLAAPMHDIGKIGIPDSILLKKGKLTPDEYAVMKEHPAIGARILAGSHSKLLQMAEDIAATHHEKWDGSGYPRGLTGNEIPLVGRVVALADVFDALTSPRVYKDAWSIDEAVSYVHGLSGGHFDPHVVEAFNQCLDRLLAVRAEHMARHGHSVPPIEVPRSEVQ
ncbi:MAG: HD domain-containing protein [Myxococcales bacterium]|nr:HD domain-containing protein [Myxococcales bacterium]